MLSGSIGIISEALHSGSDLVASIIALVSVRAAAKPADLKHRYGHEKVENIDKMLKPSSSNITIWFIEAAANARFVIALGKLRIELGLVAGMPTGGLSVQEVIPIAE